MNMNKKIVIPLIALIIVLAGGILIWRAWPKEVETPVPAVETPAPAVEIPKVSLATTKLAEVPPEYSLRADKVYFSPDGRKVTFIAKKEGKSYLILDGKESHQKYDGIYRPFSFDQESKFLYFGARIGNEFWWIAEEIK